MWLVRAGAPLPPRRRQTSPHKGRSDLTVSAGPAMLDVGSATETAANAQSETSVGQFEQAG